ncbi:MAG: DedA family protein, partial [Acidobacteriota bacterium]|nr:DedA family protein [Acidobacteriota bacterium]
MTASAPPRANFIRRLYDWVLKWAEHRHAQSALFIMAFAEASFFLVPPDVLLMAMSVARPLRAFRFAAIATVGSVTGGLAGYAIGWGLWGSLEPFAYEHLGLLGLTPSNFAHVQAMYADNAFVSLFVAGFTPIPFKVFTIAAGVFGIPLPVFVLASIIGRGSRFFLVGGLIRVLGPTVKPW